MPDITVQAEKLRTIASALRDLPNGPENEAYLQNKAGRYLEEAIRMGAFSNPKWSHFEIDAHHWFSQPLPFVSASDWLKKRGPDLGLQIDPSKNNGDLNYWAPLIAHLIERNATILEADDRTASDAAGRAAKNFWNTFQHWWKHNRYATNAVIFVVCASAISGLVVFVREVLALLGKGN